ncbi:MAG: DNA replication and repair protein RecF [Porphyromonas sp.]|nr:DNA replication and repair protein RecF [Porphyromonas sp.]
MILKRLSLVNYKNIERADLDFSDKLNCIIGANGMGKTNLLDSIYYLSFTRPNIYIPDSMVIRDGSEMAVIDAEYEANGKKDSLYLGLRNGKSKVLKRNKKTYSKLSDHIGLFPLVMISPADSELIFGGSGERRKFVDQIVCQESRQYMNAAILYRRLLEQRNAILKQPYSIDLNVLSIVDHRMANVGASILRYRAEWIERIRPLFLEYYQTISDSSDVVDLQYLSSLREISSVDFGTETSEDLLEAWQCTLDRDKALGYTTIGPHRDDLEMLLSGHLIRRVGSQGQNKSYLIALKFAQFALLRELHGNNTPIILLDDIFDKLDEHRVSRIVNLVAGEDFGQIFMTDTNRKYLDQILAQLPVQNHSILHTVDGSFTPL